MVINLEEQNSVVFVSHNMVSAMLDGKICKVIPSTSSVQVCYIYDASLKQTNRIDEIVKRDVEVTAKRFGLSTAHARIRFFECLLHNSYRLEIKKWQERGEEDPRKLQNKKEKKNYSRPLKKRDGS